MSEQIGTANEIIGAAVADYREGNPKPLVALVSAGTTEVLEHFEARELIANALRGKGAPEDPESRERRVQLLTFIHMAVAYGITARSDTGKATNRSAAEIAPRFFPFSEHTANQYWQEHNGGHLWLRAREIGAKVRRDGMGRESALQEFARLATADIYRDNMHQARKAAACGELRREQKEYTPKLRKPT